MSQLILHAGAPKTGTSFLQVMFAQHANAMMRGGVVYPRGHMFDEALKGVVTSGNGVELANFIDPTLPHVIPNKLGYKDQIDRLLSAHNGANILLSSEFLFFKAGKELETFQRIVKKHGYDVRVVYLVRDIAKAAFSTYSQQVKRHGEGRPFAEYIREWDPQYRMRVSQIVEAFGEDAVEVYNYDERSKDLNQLFFKEILNLPFIPEDNSVVNRSLTPKEAEILRIMNRTSDGSHAFSSYVSNAIIAMDKPESEPFRVTEDEAEFLNRKFSAAMEYVNQFVRGRPTVVADKIVKEREAIEFSSVERVLIALVSRLISKEIK